MPSIVLKEVCEDFFYFTITKDLDSDSTRYFRDLMDEVEVWFFQEMNKVPLKKNYKGITFWGLTEGEVTMATLRWNGFELSEE